MIFNAYKYGWNCVYFLTIEGIGHYFSEVAGSIAGAYTVDASLVIDRSAQVGSGVDRNTGLGQGLPLTFSLLDAVVYSNNVAAGKIVEFMIRPAHKCNLTQNVSPSDLTLHVDDTSGFDAAGTVYLGLEAFVYTSKTATTFVNNVDVAHARGQFGGLATAHYFGTAGGIVTQSVRIWRGRQVRLYATPVAPNGEISGATMTAEAVEIWRGVISTGPNRAGRLFTFEALALDRILDRPLQSGLTGTIVDTLPRFPIDPSSQASLHLDGYNAAGAKVWNAGAGWDILIEPFADYTADDLLSLQEQSNAVTVAWAAAVAALGAGGDIGDVLGVSDNNAGPPGSFLDPAIWHFILYFPNNAAIVQFSLSGTIGNKSIFDVHFSSGAGGFQNFKASLAGLWASSVDLMLKMPNEFYMFGISMAVQLDSPADAVPAQGMLKVGEVSGIAYHASQVLANVAYLSGLYQVGKSANAPFNPGEDLTGAQVTFVSASTFKVAESMLALLCSSGTLWLRSNPNDRLGYGDGYALQGGAGGLSAVDEASFATHLAGPSGNFQATAGGDSPVSFQSNFGGLLALAQKAIVARADSSGMVRLGLVDTHPGGSNYICEVTDNDLLTFAAEPVENVQLRDAVTQIRVKLGASGPQFVLQDKAGVQDQGGAVLDAQVPLLPGDSADVVKLAGWAKSILGQGSTLQAVDLHCVPWIVATVGDLILLNTSHPAVWDWGQGSAGFVGLARVLDAKRELTTGAKVLTVICEGDEFTRGLSIAALVISVAGGGGTPTSITIDVKYLALMVEALAAGPIDLLHYQPGWGAEDAGGSVEISAAVSSGGNCVLTVSSFAALATAIDTAKQSTLTWPRVAAATVYENLYAHADDGSVWG